jgi:hypothetical protein
MNLIKIAAYKNGAHDNQNGSLSFIPEGWAKIPDNMVIPETFPFVNITVDGEIVTSMEENREAYDSAMAKINAQKAEKSPSVQDDIDAMLVDQEYRITMLELGITV